MLSVFILAFLGALISTVPIGPINITLIALSMKPSKVFWYAASIGVITCDVVFSLIGFNLAGKINLTQEYPILATLRVPAQILILIVILGIIFTQKRQVPQSAGVEFIGSKFIKRTFKESPLLWFATGLVATVIEPGLPVFWFTWWLTYAESVPRGVAAQILVVIAVAAGDILVFKTYQVLGEFIAARMGHYPWLDYQKLGTAVLCLVAIILAADLFWQLVLKRSFIVG